MAQRLRVGRRHRPVGRRADAGGGRPGPCVFCRIADSGPPSPDNGVLWVGRTALVVLNAYPYASGHLMAVPLRHVRSLGDLTDAEADELWVAARLGVAAQEAAYSPEGVNLGANLGEAAGAGIPRHLHLHAVPRWKGDTNFMTAVADTRVLPETLASSWERLPPPGRTGDGRGMAAAGAARVDGRQAPGRRGGRHAGEGTRTRGALRGRPATVRRFYGDVLGWEAAFPVVAGMPAAAFTWADPPRAAADRGRARTPHRWGGRRLGLYHVGLRSGTPTTNCARPTTRLVGGRRDHRRCRVTTPSPTASTSSTPTATNSSCTSTFPGSTGGPTRL